MFSILTPNNNYYQHSSVSDYGVAIPTNYETRITISPTLSIASEAIRKIGIGVRQCLFESENFLSFYR